MAVRQEMVIDITKPELYPLWSPATEKDLTVGLLERMQPKFNHKQKRGAGSCSPKFLRLGTPEKGRP